MQHIDPDDISRLATKITPQWLAGFFDGEGCVNSRIVNDGLNTSVRVMITQSDPNLLNMILSKFPSASFTPFKHKLKDGRGITTTYCITWNGRNCIPILEYIKDYVIAKERQVNLALEFCNLIKSVKFSLSSENHVKRCEIARKLKDLNQREQNYIPN